VGDNHGGVCGIFIRFATGACATWVLAGMNPVHQAAARAKTAKNTSPITMALYLRMPDAGRYFTEYTPG
jgi:hypothetical protein